jgi:hypothetical protein
MYQAWSKSTYPGAVGSTAVERFHTLAFSGDGSILACHYGSPVILFFRTTDGTLLNSQKYSILDTVST